MSLRGRPVSAILLIAVGEVRPQQTEARPVRALSLARREQIARFLSAENRNG